MNRSRLTQALEAGLFELPASGPVCFLNPPGDADLGGLAPERVHAVQGFYPEFAILEARGITTTPTSGGLFAATVVQCHRARAASLDLIWQAFRITQPGGLIVIEGSKTDGVESLGKELRRHVEFAGSYAKAHGKLFWITRPHAMPQIDQWEAEPIRLADGFETWPGAFSADKIDKGSELLAAHLPPLKGRVADLGAGWGFLSRAILTSPAVTGLDLIEADFMALEAARRNISDPRASFHWADARHVSAPLYDAIVTNPPFHTGRAAEPSLGQDFIRAAAKMLTGGGRFWMVANRNLPYEQVLAECFGRVDTIVQDQGFKVIAAARAKTTRARR